MSNNAYRDLVARATNENLIGEDWETNLLICDYLTTRPDECTDHILQAIKVRLANRNPKVQLLALALLDTCVKNTSTFFHRKLASREFLGAVEERAMSRHSNEIGSRNKALELIQYWAQNFRGKIDSYTDLYEGLRRRGAVFPASHVTAPINVTPSSPPPVSRTSAPSRTATTNAAAGAQSKERKLREDLVVVKENAALLNDMVSATTSANELKQNDLAQELAATCRDMQGRIMRLIEGVSDETMLVELLAANDLLATTIQRYEQALRGIKTAPPVSTATTTTATQRPQPSATAATATRQQTDVFDLDELLGARGPIPVPVPASAAAPQVQVGGNDVNYLEREFDSLSLRRSPVQSHVPQQQQQRPQQQQQSGMQLGPHDIFLAGASEEDDGFSELALRPQTKSPRLSPRVSPQRSPSLSAQPHPQPQPQYHQPQHAIPPPPYHTQPPVAQAPAFSLDDIFGVAPTTTQSSDAGLQQQQPHLQQPVYGQQAPNPFVQPPNPFVQPMPPQAQPPQQPYPAMPYNTGASSEAAATTPASAIADDFEDFLNSRSTK